MTLEELCKKYNVSESSVTTKFSRTKESILKKYGVEIVKEGRGKNAQYFEHVAHEDSKRAISIYEEEQKDQKDIPMIKDDMGLMNWDFLVFLTIAITPMGVFRGSFKSFLKYIEVRETDENVEILKASLKNLQDRDLIQYLVDKTDETYFIASIYRAVENDLKIEIKMVKECRRLQQENNKRSWVPLLKTWLCLNTFVDEGHLPYTYADITEMTGLSEYQARESIKILNQSNYIRSYKKYAGKNKCLGTLVDLNAFKMQ